MTNIEHTTGQAAVERPLEQAETAHVAWGSPLENAENIGAPLLVTLVGGMALVLAILTPVGLIKLAAGLIVAAAGIVLFRLLKRRGGDVR